MSELSIEQKKIYSKYILYGKQYQEENNYERALECFKNAKTIKVFIILLQPNYDKLDKKILFLENELYNI